MTTASRTGSMRSVWILLLLLLALPATRHAGSNVMVRFATTVRIVDAGTTELGSYASQTNDLATHGGKFYNDKAPGVSLINVPAYALVRLITDNFDAARHACRLLTLTLFTLFTAWWLHRRLPAWGVEGITRDTAAVAYCVSTVGWAYFAMLFGHGYVANFIMLGVLFLVDYRREPESVRSLVVAGVCFGAAIATEYPVAVLGLIAGIYLLLFERRVSRVAVFAALGAAAPLLVILAINYANFGDPFRLGYSIVKDPRYFGAMNQGFMGINLPTLGNFFEITLSPGKGVFFWSPLLLMGLAGLPIAFRQRRAEQFLLGGMVLAYLFVFSGYFEAGGGACLACRHLTPVFGPLILVAALAASRSPRRADLFFLLAAASSVLALVGVFAEPQMPERLANPLWEFALPLWREGLGPGNILGLPDRVAQIAAAVLLATTWLFVAQGNGMFRRKRGKWDMAAPAVVLAAVFIFLLALPFLPRTEPGLYHQVRGNNFMVREDYTRAVGEYEQAFATRPDPWVLYYLARAHLKLGNEQKAEAVLEKLLAIDPEILRPDAKKGTVESTDEATTNDAPTPAGEDQTNDSSGAVTP
ncbi:MAG: tetratricopeptide repeat protein [Candidatus Lernaella stagnicola]|nr:tetratricopeptide repeat protein [Candidatus Lernaella stagnicola]